MKHKLNNSEADAILNKLCREKPNLMDFLFTKEIGVADLKQNYNFATGEDVNSLEIKVLQVIGKNMSNSVKGFIYALLDAKDNGDSLGNKELDNVGKMFFGEVLKKLKGRNGNDGLLHEYAQAYAQWQNEKKKFTYISNN